MKPRFRHTNVTQTVDKDGNIHYRPTPAAQKRVQMQIEDALKRLDEDEENDDDAKDDEDPGPEAA